METKEELRWLDFATAGDDGFPNDIRDDAPEFIKIAYKEYIDRHKWYIDNNIKEPR